VGVSHYWHNLENKHKTTTTQKNHAHRSPESDQNKTRDTSTAPKPTQQSAQQLRAIFSNLNELEK
jgi:hypothetical protein